MSTQIVSPEALLLGRELLVPAEPRQRGQIGNRCPGTNTLHTFESGFCLNECGETCVPHSVLMHIQNKVRVDKHQGQYISVTALLGCLRAMVLERSIPYYIEPTKNWYSVRGTLIHNILQNPGFAAYIEDMATEVHRCFVRGEISRDVLEKSWAKLELALWEFAKVMPRTQIPDWESEVEYEYPLGIINGRYRFLRGTIDVLRRQMGKILDYKTIGDMGIGIIKNGPKKEHAKQFNLYRFMVERGYPVGMSYQTYKPPVINEIQAYYMTMMQVVGTGTNMEELTGFQKAEPFKHSSEVSREVIAMRNDVVLKRGKRHETAKPEDYELSEKKNWKIVYAIPKVELEPLDELELFIHEQCRIVIEAFDNGAMPAMCEPEMREWKCDKFCPKEIRTACDDYNTLTGETRIPKKQDPNTVPVEA